MISCARVFRIRPTRPSVKNTLRGYSDQVILTDVLETSYHAVTVLPQYTVTQYEETPVTTTTYRPYLKNETLRRGIGSCPPRTSRARILHSVPCP
jgi:hypothetical protein